MGPRRKFSNEFKLDAVLLTLQDDRTVKEVSEEMDIPETYPQSCVSPILPNPSSPFNSNPKLSNKHLIQLIPFSLNQRINISVFENCFAILLLLLDGQEQIVGLEDKHRLILELLGGAYMGFYGINGERGAE